MSTTQRKSMRTSAKRRLDFGDDDNDNSVIILEKEIQVNDEAKAKTSILVPATPEKKRRRRDTNQGISTYFSPVKASDAKKAAIVVTPEQKDETEQEEKVTVESQPHVPIYIHKNVGYQRRGEASISDKLKRVFDLVEEHYSIPADFESNRSFGPLSGTCFEERAVNAYEKGLLKAAKTGQAVLICTYCGTVGHEADECPDLI